MTERFCVVESADVCRLHDAVQIFFNLPMSTKGAFELCRRKTGRAAAFFLSMKW